MTQARTILKLAGAAIFAGLVALAIPSSGAQARTNTQCTGARCVGSDCTWDGDARNCWQESVYYREPGERVRWVCDRSDRNCTWMHVPNYALVPHDMEYGGY
ncbi:MAG TPA: hypothetical protein VMD53_02420 [Rhizomicrobium sp.]|nr:hypothetical protein [Rhizomicrobium sp.]